MKSPPLPTLSIFGYIHLALFENKTRWHPNGRLRQGDHRSWGAKGSYIAVRNLLEFGAVVLEGGCSLMGQCCSSSISILIQVSPLGS
jgi:hypothetical protein